MPPKVNKAPQPPPIIVENIKKYQQFYDCLIKHVPFLTKITHGDSVKINALDEISYRAICKLLLRNNCHWYSYEKK